MTQDEITQSIIEKYATIGSGDIFHIASLNQYLESLRLSKELYNYKCNIDDDHLYVTIQKRSHSNLHSFELKQYYREQRLKKLLNGKGN